MAMRKFTTMLLTLWMLWYASLAYSALELELTQGVRGTLPVAVLPFDNQTNQQTASIVSDMIQQDLQLSGQFKLIEGDLARAYPTVDTAYWRKRGVNNIVIGKIQPIDAKQQLVSFELLDPVNQQRTLLKQQFTVHSNDLRSLGHHIADLIYHQLIGDPGIFSTRIAYVVVKRTTNKPAQYLLEIADIDGHDAKPLLTSSAPIMSPTWSPDGKQIAYVTFENKQAEIHVAEVATGKRRILTRYPGINGAPAWSPDGRQLAMVLSKDGHPNIYLLDVASKQLTQLTSGASIDTEPSFIPDGKAIVFTSNRGGSPQIYRLQLADKAISRVTFQGNYNATASLTPDGKQLVLLHRSPAGKFTIASQDFPNGDIIPLTHTDFNESPSVAPNGKMVIYATQAKGSHILVLASIDGRVHQRLPMRTGEVQEPAWGPLTD
jgi:TolB protein